MSMGLLVFTSCHVGPLGFYLFFWILTSHLLYFYVSLCLWAWWLSLPAMLAHLVFTSFRGLSWPICFYCVSFILFLLYLPSLLGFFCCWASCQKRVSTLTNPYILIHKSQHFVFNFFTNVVPHFIILAVSCFNGPIHLDVVVICLL